MKPTGFEIWRGNSPHNGQPIVAILTTKTANRKTGDMPQLWILSASMNPVITRRVGHDTANCGSCPLKTGLCYVNLGQAPLAVYRAWRAGKYPKADLSLVSDPVHAAVAGKAIRLGAYGDPAMLPAGVIDSLLLNARGHTGYTHQWRHSYAQAYKGVLMASCDTIEQAKQAQALGWNTFRHTGKPVLLQSEKPCLSDAKGLQCDECMRCNGSRGNYVVANHGPSKARMKG